MSNSIPRESVEFQAVTVAVSGAVVTTGVEFAIATDGTRPTTWAAATTLSGKIGVMIAALAPGRYRIWARITSSPETPVVDCGTVVIT